MKILAHRGWWITPAEKNTALAFRRAFESGFGIETDVRDLAGELVISHDMPTGPGLMTFAELLDMHATFGDAGTLAINIKADGLQEALAHDLRQRSFDDYFCFDMAVPDALGYLRRGFRSFTRHSEIERIPSFLDEAAGVWIDAFYDDWATVELIEGYLASGKQVALVSPELHGRDHLSAWSWWKGLKHENLYVCTDFPDRAHDHWQ